MQQCGFCSMLSGLMRRVSCIGSRRGSSDSYYRELGDQDTLKIGDKASDSSENSNDLNKEINEDISGSIIPNAELQGLKEMGVCNGRFLTMHKRRKKRLLTRSLTQEIALLDDLLPGQVQCILLQSTQWKFNAFTLENVSGGRCLPVLCVHLFQMYGLLNHFKLDANKAWRLFSMIEEGYHSTNPYHNSVHAADVTQAMHCFLQQKRIREHMEPLEILACLIAAIAHDIDHPGVNQPFLIATSNHLAALYRNTSVLENHHWRCAVSCLIESGLIDQKELQTELEYQICSLILATDITRQQDYLSQFKVYLDSNTLDMTKRNHRHLVLQIALKCADISNPCRPWEISRKWSLKVCEEFFRQGDYERKLNLPVTALCDRHTTSIPKIQIGFFKFVVTPLITEWHKFLQNDLSVQMLENLVYNQSKWEMLAAQEIADETRTEISDADMVDDDLETGSISNLSDSSEMLLPLRRSSLIATKQVGLKEQLRRFSVPLNVFQDSRFKNKSQSGSTSECLKSELRVMLGSEHSLHSQLSVRGQCDLARDSGERVISSEKLLPDSSIATLTTARQASRLSHVLTGGAGSKLIRQQTFPPLDGSVHATLLAAQPLHTSNEEVIYPSRSVKTDKGQKYIDIITLKESRLGNFFNRNDTDKTDYDDATNKLIIVSESSRKNEKDKYYLLGDRSSHMFRRESAPVGSQLRDNIHTAALHGAMSPGHTLLRRRQSMPAEALACATKEKKLREVTSALPQLLCRTFSTKEPWTQRRGSAPVAAAPSELRGLTSLGSFRHSVNGGRRKPNPITSCHQWLAKTSYTVQEKTFQQFPRRSSLPVEVLRPSEGFNKLKQSSTN